MPAKSVTYNSQNYAGTLGSGLLISVLLYIMVWIYICKSSAVYVFIVVMGYGRVNTYSVLINHEHQ